MEQFNRSLVRTILRKCKGLSLKDQVSRTEGRFLADKSYAFDTMFFVCRYIEHFRFGDRYTRFTELEDDYIADLFCLEKGKSQVGNYFTEALALLRFLKAVEMEGKRYRIIDGEIIKIFASGFENSYVFLYLLCRSVFKDNGLWRDYENFCKAGDQPLKQKAYDKLRSDYAAIDARIRDRDKLWAWFTPKYPVVVLNYANRQNMVTRTGNVRNDIVTRKDISLNTEGTRNQYDIPKKNSYLKEMSESYILETLRPYLTWIPPQMPVEEGSCLSVDIADTKLAMITSRYGINVEGHPQRDKYRIAASGSKTRTVQGEFRQGLLKKTPHCCPVCGFSYEDFLIASHIRPYAMCEDTYDAMNPHNGLLLCPVCDKLFESANLMTIDAQSGKVVYAAVIEDEKDFQYLHGKKIRSEYIDCERRHYLKWHNEHFRAKHKESSVD